MTTGYYSPKPRSAISGRRLLGLIGVLVAIVVAGFVYRQLAQKESSPSYDLGEAYQDATEDLARLRADNEALKAELALSDETGLNHGSELGRLEDEITALRTRSSRLEEELVRARANLNQAINDRSRSSSSGSAASSSSYEDAWNAQQDAEDDAYVFIYRPFVAKHDDSLSVKGDVNNYNRFVVDGWLDIEVNGDRRSVRMTIPALETAGYGPIYFTSRLGAQDDVKLRWRNEK